MHIHYQDSEQAFYDHAKQDLVMQAELKDAKDIEEVLEITNRHGFHLGRESFIVHRNDWCDKFFPWSKMPTSQVREFMHKRRDSKS